MRVTDLRIAGPTPMPPAVMQAMQRPMIYHRGATFRGFFKGLLKQLERVHQTEGSVLVLPGSGSAGWEIALVNTLSPGDRVLAVVAGDFGERWASVAARFGLQVERVEVPWGRAATAEIVGRVLAENPDVKAVLYTYNETSTGVANPLPEVGELVRQHGGLLLVDGVSAVAGMPLEMDSWGVDLIFSGSQKAWMCPPGLVIVGVGPRAWAASERAGFPRAFWDLREYREQARAGDMPSTAPLTLLYALQAACDLIEAEGLERVFARHRALAELVRAGASRLGYQLLADPAFASPTVTALLPPDGLEADTVVQELRARHGIEVNGGQGRLRGKILRVGHMGWVHEPELHRLLAALEAVSAAYRRPR
uniref:Alanine--glyoxylate aminotransferase family protein n=1 Tax=Thermorudis peleae TaxID=1382356 RepID=A0A831TCG1_9BACT